MFINECKTLAVQNFIQNRHMVSRNFSANVGHVQKYAVAYSKNGKFSLSDNSYPRGYLGTHRINAKLYSVRVGPREIGARRDARPVAPGVVSALPWRVHADGRRTNRSPPRTLSIRTRPCTGTIRRLRGTLVRHATPRTGARAQAPP